ncbi:hypothetical protein RvY_03928-2 [Ramazzottius varieornatus]|uniref:G-protein coupled receptors family 1 profile domain-containing protein n=1 Tax=Ramazzottius varieornatus TaxID=947166 RepID=A0A1D1UZ27_RAMVA|nr:hypothetical protein RvY_03928-2 [Ramazzottius varieornatus]
MMTSIADMNDTFPNLNGTILPKELPAEMKFGIRNVMVIVTYANLMWISLLGNCIVLWKLYYRKNRSRVHFMLLHLCIADLLVTVIEMPLQIGWKSTVEWVAGDVFCRLFGYLRVIGLYLNAFLLIAISIDRFMSVWDPLSTVTRATYRAKAMVCISWFLSLVCAIPQLNVWSLRSHPEFPWYHQCVTFGAFETRAAELAYGWFITILMYGLPLIAIIVCYAGIWFRISYYSKWRGQQDVTESILRDPKEAARFIPETVHPSHEILNKAKSRTLKMTALVVTIFVACWSPYQLIHIWYFVDRESAHKVNLVFQEVLFIFGVSSCVVDPYVYGLYSMGIWNEIEFLSTFTSCATRYDTRTEDKRGSFTADAKNLRLEVLRISRGRPVSTISGTTSETRTPLRVGYKVVGRPLRDDSRRSVITCDTRVIQFSSQDAFR